jgi:hypothetical protein
VVDEPPAQPAAIAAPRTSPSRGLKKIGFRFISSLAKVIRMAG